MTKNALNASMSSVAFAAALFAGCTPAIAQSNAGAAQDEAAQEDSAGGVGDIVVTARKTSERAVDVPISLVAVSGEQLASKGVVQLQDLAVSVPNFRQTNGATGTFRSIRGGGSPGSNFAFEQSTGLFVDNISYGRNVHSFIPIFDVDRVEVLRGPQVIAFGNSTTSGAISISTKKPGSDFGGNLEAAYEFNNNELVLRGGIDIPLGEKVSVRLAGFAQILDRGWVANIRPTDTFFGPKYRNYAGRVTVVAKLDDSLEAKFKYEHDRIKIEGSSLQATFNPASDPNIVEANLDGVSYAFQPSPYDGRRDQQHMDADTLLFELTKEFGDQTLVSTTGYTRYFYDQDLDADVGPKAIAATHPQDDYKQFTQELRLYGPLSSNLKYAVGAYYQHEVQRPRFLFNQNTALGRLALLDTRANQISVFGGLTWKPVEQLTIDAAVRYSSIRRTSDQYARRTTPLTYNVIPDSPGFVSHTFTGIETPDDFVMPQLVLSYQPTRDLNFYAKVVKGDKAGGVDAQYVGQIRTSASFRAEKATSYELGAKAILLDRALSLNLAIFRSDFDNLQVSSFNGVTNAFEVRNAASSRSQGVEFDATLAPIGGLRLNASLAYLDAKYLQFPEGPCTPEQALLVPAPCKNNLSGQRTPFNSTWTASGGIEYRASVGSLFVTPRIDFSYRSSYNPTTNNDPLLVQSGFTLVDARIDLATADERFTIGLFGRNLTDKIYSEVALGAPFTNRVRLGDTSRGRQLGVNVGVKF